MQSTAYSTLSEGQWAQFVTAERGRGAPTHRTATKPVTLLVASSHTCRHRCWCIYTDAQRVQNMSKRYTLIIVHAMMTTHRPFCNCCWNTVEHQSKVCIISSTVVKTNSTTGIRNEMWSNCPSMKCEETVLNKRVMTKCNNNRYRLLITSKSNSWII